METFFSFLEKRVEDSSSLLCLGLDPHASDLPQPTAEAALAFCLNLVKQTSPYAAAFKPNAAFFEAFGPDGWAALKELMAAIVAGSYSAGSRIPVILDAKRGDIASTAEAYASSAFEKLGADAVTLNPYLGRDSIEPFLADPQKGVFLLCKTSNPGAADLQDVSVVAGADGRPPRLMYEHVAHLARSWNTRNNVGLVVGATQPEALARVRAAAPDLWFLAPGVGAQGGELEAALRAGVRADGRGMLISVSRSIARAGNPARAAAGLRDQIINLQYELSKARLPDRTAGQDARHPASTAMAELADGLLQAGCVRFGKFTLKSGLVSPIYLDLRRLVSYPTILRRAAQAYANVLSKLEFDRLAGLPYAALPIGTAVALEMDRPLIYPRREVKDYGTRAAIECEFNAGETIAVIDDLATTGDTKVEAIQRLEAAGLIVRDIVVLIDREQGAQAALAQAGYRMHAVATLRELLSAWRSSGAITEAQFDEVMVFLKK